MVVVMEEGHEMTNQTQLNISKYDDGNADEFYQLEIVEEEDYGELNSKFANMGDGALDEAIVRNKGHLVSLRDTLKDPAKLGKQIAELEREKQCRKRKREQGQMVLKSKKEPEAPANDLLMGKGDDKVTRASPFSERNIHDNLSKTDGVGRGNRSPTSQCLSSSDEVQILNPKEGEQFFPRISPSTPGSSGDGGKNKLAAFPSYGAGPCTRQRFRRECRLCSHCGKSNLKNVSPDTGENGDLCVPCHNRLRSHDSSPEESPIKSRPLSVFGRQNNAGKRVMQGGQLSPQKVVELFSSDDEEEGTPDSFAEFKVPHQTNVYGTRSRHGSRVHVKVAYPSRDDPEAVEVADDDLRRLDPMEFLNDTVIDFYIKYMQRPENLTQEQKDKFYFFNSFFYKKLSEIANGPNKKQKPDFSKLRKWTKRTNIFEKDYLFVPIHDKWHWSLAIVCHPGATSEDTGSQRCILHLDSMSPGHKSNWVFKLLRTYLLEEWKHQAHEDGLSSVEMLNPDYFETKKIPVPQQENESDCGLFLLHYMECFIKDAPPTFKISDVNQGKMFGKSWFAPSRASSLRRDIQQLLEKMFKIEAAQTGAQVETFLVQRGEEQKPGLEDVQPVNGVEAEDEHDMEITEGVSSPGQPSATPLVQEMDVESTSLANGSGSPGSLPHEDTHMNSKILESKSSKLDEDLRGDTNLCADTLSNLSRDLGLPTLPKPQGPVDLDAMDEDQGATLAKETTETNEFQQSNGVGKDLPANAHLVVDLDIEKQADDAAHKGVDRMASDNDLIPLD